MMIGGSEEYEVEEEGDGDADASMNGHSVPRPKRRWFGRRLAANRVSTEGEDLEEEEEEEEEEADGLRANGRCARLGPNACHPLMSGLDRTHAIS